MDSGYQLLNKDDEELFELHSKGIDKAVRETFPSIPANFKLKAVTIQKLLGCGIFYDFKIALPDDKFARVSFHTGGLPAPHAFGKKEPEQHFDVDPTPSATQYE